MVRRFIALVAAVVCVSGALVPARANLPLASVETLRPLFQHLLGNPEMMQLDVVPDLYPGGYARISVYAKSPDIEGMRIDELWIRLIGVSFDPALLDRGTLKVLSTRDSAIYGRLSLDSVRDFLNHQGVAQDVHLRLDGDAIEAQATVLFNGVPTRVRMAGIFQVDGEPEVFFHITALFVNSIPVPFALVDRLERQINPIVDFRTWPVAFPIRSFRQSADGLVLSSQGDIGAPCSACGGPAIQLKP